MPPHVPLDGVMVCLLAMCGMIAVALTLFGVIESVKLVLHLRDRKAQREAARRYRDNGDCP